MRSASRLFVAIMHKGHKISPHPRCHQLSEQPEARCSPKRVGSRVPVVTRTSAAERRHPRIAESCQLRGEEKETKTRSPSWAVRPPPTPAQLISQSTLDLDHSFSQVLDAQSPSCQSDRRPGPRSVLSTAGLLPKVPGTAAGIAHPSDGVGSQAGNHTCGRAAGHPPTPTPTPKPTQSRTLSSFLCHVISPSLPRTQRVEPIRGTMPRSRGGGAWDDIDPLIPPRCRFCNKDQVDVQHHE